MASETIKTLLMLAIFGALEAALHMPEFKKPVRAWVSRSSGKHR